MKALVTFWLSILLVMGQDLMLAGATEKNSKPTVTCACAGCNTQSCCCEASDQSAPLRPAALPRTTEQSQLQLLVATPGQILKSPVHALFDTLPFSVPLLPSSAVPLYERYCSFLI